MMLLMPFATDRDPTRQCGEVDLLQLDQKIRNGEIKQLTVRGSEIIARDRVGDCDFRVFTSNESSRQTILKNAREEVNGRPRVEKVAEENSQSEVPMVFPVGIMLLFGAHFLTILLIMGLMPFYVILAVKDERHDQSMRIIWIVLMCMVGMFAMPIYWFLYVWREKAPGNSAAGASASVAE